MAEWDAEVGEYFKHERRATRAGCAAVLGIGLAIVFHNPPAWGDGRVATIVQYAGWAAIVVFSIVAALAKAASAERKGYCRGKYGRAPWELARSQVSRDEESRGNDRGLR